MVSRIFPYEVNDILHQLAFIEQIPNNHKIDMTRKTQYHKDSWVCFYYRWSKGIDRISSIKSIEEVINDAVIIIEKSKNEEYTYLLINSLNKIIHGGLKRLKDTTYAEDPNICTRILTLIDGIEMFLRKYEEYIELEEPSKDVTQEQDADEEN